MDPKPGPCGHVWVEPSTECGRLPLQPELPHAVALGEVALLGPGPADPPMDQKPSIRTCVLQAEDL